MTLAAQIKQDLAIVFNDDEFAESINYRPKVGAAVNIPALVDLAFDADLGSLVGTTLDVSIPDTGITGIVGVGDPKAGDLALIRGRICRLTDFTTDPDGMHDCTFAVGAVE